LLTVLRNLLTVLRNLLTVLQNPKTCVPKATIAMKWLTAKAADLTTPATAKTAFREMGHIVKSVMNAIKLGRQTSTTAPQSTPNASTTTIWKATIVPAWKDSHWT